MRRQIFEMSAEQYATLMSKFQASRSVPPQEKEAFIDAAWNELGAQMGFEGLTARCHLGNPRVFTAIPKEKEDGNRNVPAEH